MPSMGQLSVLQVCCPTLEKTQYLMAFLFDNLSFARKCPVHCHKKKSPTGAEPDEVLRSRSESQGDRAENYFKIFLYKSFLSVWYMYTCMCVPWPVCRGQRTTCGGFSFFTMGSQGSNSGHILIQTCAHTYVK